jgi:hypothetical protein
LAKYHSLSKLEQYIESKTTKLDYEDEKHRNELDTVKELKEKLPKDYHIFHHIILANSRKNINQEIDLVIVNEKTYLLTDNHRNIYQQVKQTFDEL